MAKVDLIDVCKVYKGNVRAVTDFNLEIKDGEFIIFVGPSGCGKSTTLRMIAGLEEITSGKVYIGDTLVNQVEPKDRDIAMVFQNYALYPHMSVYENLSYSLKCHHENKEVIDEKVKEVATLLGIDEYLERKPKELSGGQRQRVALGRCLIRKPKVYLFDEPLSNLDAKLRVQMRSEISKLHQKVKGTFIYVTHDQIEAMTMGDRIVVMKDGFVQQIDTPVNLYEHPANIFVATFLGSPQMNIFNVTLRGSEVCLDENVRLKLSERIMTRIIGDYEGKELVLGIRPGDFTLSNESDYDFKIDKIELVEKLGNETLLYFSLPGREESAIASIKLDMRDDLSGTVYLKVNKEKIHLFNKDERSILKENDINCVPVSLKMEGENLWIDNKFKYPHFTERCISEENITEKGYLQFTSKAMHLHREEGDVEFDLEILLKDEREQFDVYYAKIKESNQRITFLLDHEENRTDKELKLYVSLKDLAVCDEKENIISIADEFVKPILPCKIKRFGKDSYILSNNKEFIKQNKCFLIEKIHDLNDRMLLCCTNQKEEKFSFLTDKNSDFFAGMMLYVKKE